MALNLSAWWHRRRVQAEMRLSGRVVQTHRVTNPYHAVSIKAGPTCRQTAADFAGRRFLSGEAPALPLPTCDARNCSCRYQHHEDRRTGHDRRHRANWAANAKLAAGGDRRRIGGRRVTDQ